MLLNDYCDGKKWIGGYADVATMLGPGLGIMSSSGLKLGIRVRNRVRRWLN